jgi:hypothetical protein
VLRVWGVDVVRCILVFHGLPVCCGVCVLWWLVLVALPYRVRVLQFRVRWQQVAACVHA